MAYAVDAPNDISLRAVSRTDNPNQLDMFFFSDFLQANAVSSVSPAQGGFLIANSANGGAIGQNVQATSNLFGVTGAFGHLTLSTGGTSNSSGYASVYTLSSTIPGIPTPTTGQITKYEMETLIRTGSTLHDNSVRGTYKFGLQNSITNGTTSDGVYYEFLYNGTTNDTKWNIVFRKDNVEERVDTGVTVSASKTYRLYLCVERDTAGNFTTTYNVKNVTDNTTNSGTAAPSNTARYPSADDDSMGVVLTNSKTTTTSASARDIYCDYISARIRRPISREILLSI